MVESADGLSSLLRQARKSAGWTQAELAEKAKVSASVIQKSEARTGYNLGKKAGSQILDALREHIEAVLLEQLESALKEQRSSASQQGQASETESRWATVLEVVEHPGAFSAIATSAEREWDRLTPDLHPGDRRRFCEHLLTVSGMLSPGMAMPMPENTLWIDVVSSDRSYFIKWVQAYSKGGYGMMISRCAFTAALAVWFGPSHLERILKSKNRPTQINAVVLPDDWIPEDLKGRVKDTDDDDA